MADSSATAASSGTSSSAASVSGLQHPRPAPVSSIRVMTSRKERPPHKGEPDRREAPVAAAEGPLASIPEAETQVELTVQAPTTTFHTPGRVTVVL